MTSEKEPAKTLLPYLQRADELQKHEPLVAYYCRLYAMELGLKIPQSDRTNTTKALLVSLMKQLEKDKKSLALGPQDHLHLEGFASNVFAKADKQDRAGRADLNTAKTFYAAGIFLDILNQFGQLEPDLEQKQKYSVWKAADIRKALNEGRKPIPGPPGGESVSYTSNASSGEYGAEFDGNGITVQPMAFPGGTAPEPDLSPDLHPHDDFQHPSNEPEPSSVPQSSTYGFSPQSPYSNNSPEPSNVPQSSSTFAISPQSQYPTDGAHQPYYPQQYQPAPDPPFPQHYSSSSPEVPPYTYPNFQSYPSFSESSLPSAPTHYPSYHQGSDYSQAPPPSNTTAHPSNSPYNSSGKVNGSVSEPSPPTSSRKFKYDSSYQPPPEKIAEAHKAARFAVGALAFDDVSVAVDHLIKSLELLTNPSVKN